MQKSLFTLSFLGLSLLASPQAQAAVFSQIIGFGDSLSDTGNVNSLVQAATMGQFSFPPPPYFAGRFSNGPIWLEHLASSLNIPLSNAAFGGATSGAANTLDTTFNNVGLGALPLIGLQQQIGGFLGTSPTPDPLALYVIWIGVNDYLPTDSTGFTPYANPTTTLTNLQGYLNALAPVNPQNILLVNLPDLGEIPKTRNTPQPDNICPVGEQFDPDCLNQLSEAHNLGLASLVAPGSARISILDVNGLFDDIRANPAHFGLTNVTEGCLQVACANPGEFFFWDEQHPTSSAHSLIANRARQTLGIPEPSTLAGLFLLATLGVALKPRKH